MKVQVSRTLKRLVMKAVLILILLLWSSKAF
jgi:hypothetical protein